MKKLNAALLCTLLLSTGCHQKVDDAPVFPLMAWYNSGLGDDTGPVLSDIKRAGFNLAAMPFISKEKNLEWLGTADSLGIELLLSDHRIDQYIQDPQSGYAVLDSMILDYSQHPSFAGYFIYDKPDSHIFNKLSQCVQYLNKKDAGHVSIINVYPEQAPDEQNFYYDLWQIMDHVQPRLVCFEQYPDLENHSDYFANLEALRSVCLDQKVPFWNTLIPTLHHVNDAMEKSQLKMQVFSALAYGVSGLAFYSSAISDQFEANNGFSNNHQPGIEYFDYICNMNQYIMHISPALEKLVSTGVYHTGPVPAGCIALSPGLPISQVEASNFILGFLTDGQEKFVWIVNKNIDNGAAPVITLAPNVKEIVEIAGPDQEPYHKNVYAKKEHDIQLIFKAGEGRLFRLLEE